MPSFKYQGQRISYEEFGGGPAAVTEGGGRGRTAASGPARARPLVLIPGLLLSGEMHRPLAEALAARGNHVITIDLLGHGASDRPRDMWRYSMQFFAQQVVALMDHLQIEQAAVMGTSLGANTALEIAAAYPDRRTFERPALVLGHRRDPVHPFSDAGMLVEELPNARLIEADSILELRVKPERLENLIAEFLDEIWAAPQTRRGGRAKRAAKS